MTRMARRIAPNGRSGTSLRSALERPSMALAPREAGLHLWPHDSIGGVNERSCRLPDRSRRLDVRACDGRAAVRGRAGRPARRARVARDPPRHDAGPAGAPGDRAADRRLHRLRSVGRFAPHRPPRADLRAAPAAAPRRPAGRARRWRDRDDRRPVGAFVRAQPARPRHARGERRGASAAQLERFLDFSPGAGGAVMVNNLDWLGRAVADRLPARHRQALHDPVHARQGLGPGPPRARAVVHRVQLHAPAGVRLRPPAPDDGRRAADGRRRPVGQHHGRPRAHPADEPGAAEDARRRRTASPTSSCSRRRGRSSARARRASRSGWTRRGPRRTRSTSTGSTPTTATSARTCAGSPSCRASEIEALEAEIGARARGAGRRSGRSPATSRRGRTARRRPTRAIADSEAMFSAAPIADPAVLRVAATSRPAGSRSTRRSLGRGAAVLLAEAGRLRLAGRGAPDDRGRRRDDQRRRA